MEVSQVGPLRDAQRLRDRAARDRRAVTTSGDAEAKRGPYAGL